MESVYPIPVGPTNADLVKGVIRKWSDSGFDFCASDPSLYSPASLFFYHVPKTGGMRFSLPIALTIENICRNEKAEIIQELLASEMAPAALAEYSRDNQNIKDAMEWDGYVFYSDHNAEFGLHQDLYKRSGKKMFSACVLREPDARLRSALRYLLRTNERDASIVRDLIRHGHHHIENPITRRFAGKEVDSRVSTTDVAKAFENISSLDFCLHQESYSHVRRLQHSYISRNRLPNIICTKYINKTPVEESDETKELITEFTEMAMSAGRNEADKELYQIVIDKNPVDSDIASYTIDSLHPLTTIVNISTPKTGAMTYGKAPTTTVRTIDLLLGKVDPMQFID